MDLVQLPIDVLRIIMLFLDVSDMLACKQVCLSWRRLICTISLRSKISFAQAGMVDVPGSVDLSLEDRVKAADCYRDAWRTARLQRFSNLPVPHHAHRRIVDYSGCLIPILCGSRLTLYLPPSPARHIKYQTWTFDIKENPIDIECCVSNLPQHLVILMVKDDMATTYAAHILALGHPPAVTYRTDPVIYGYLLGLFCVGAPYSYIRVYNWRTGRLVWAKKEYFSTMYFTFIDQHHLVVASAHGDRLRVYTICSDDPTDVAASPPPEAPCPYYYELLLPQAIEGSSTAIRGMSARAPSGGPLTGAAVNHDPRLTVLALDLRLKCDLRYLPDICTPQGITDEALFLIVPLSALLVTANRDGCYWGTGVGEDASKTPAIPWVVWGEPCCRVLLQKPGSHWCIPDALGSMCLLTRFPSALEEPEFREFYICDFHPWARHGNVEDDAADLAQHCVDGVVDTASGLVQLRNLRDPIKNTLPFWVIRRDLTLDCADFTNPIVYRDRTFQVLLEDGVAAVVSLLLGGSPKAIDASVASQLTSTVQYTKFSTDQSSTLYMLGV
ncbi:hypothetical protein C8Q77DRAFT_1118809 [Trametes polyzona]|nr:hypothetical protein C8Q77DRAFT_1118809 [Trametes polyzona]